MSDISKTFIEKIAAKIREGKSADKTKLDKQGPSALELQAAVWIEDVFSESTVSSGALIKVKGNRLYVGSTSAWNDLEGSPSRNAVVGIPLQEFELNKLDKESNQALIEGNGLFAEIRFCQFVFSEDNVRFAEFEIISVIKDEAPLWGRLLDFLKRRENILSSGLPQTNSWSLD